MKELSLPDRGEKVKMEGFDMQNNYHEMMPAGAMEDSLFPFIGDNCSTLLSDHATRNRSKEYSSTCDEQSDLEADSMPESQMELTEADVYTQLEHKERDLILAAELGKSLLEKNEELVQDHEKLCQEFHEKIEALEQEKFELRQRLEYKTSECETNALQLNGDIMRTQEELQERKAVLAATEREKTRAIEELTEQNQKLLTQLQLASDAEQHLSAQVQQLRREFLERSNSATSKILQLENLKEEIQQGCATRVELESHYGAMKDETIQLREELTSASERVHQLERQLHDRERELKRVVVELNDAHASNRQLQTRVDELREEISMQTSFASNANSNSLLSELEESGFEHGVFDFRSPVTSNTDDVIEKNGNLDDIEQTELSTDPDWTKYGDEVDTDVTLRCYKALMNGVNKCHHQLFELKQDMWESYQRVQTVSTCLRSFVHKQSGDLPKVNGAAPHPLEENRPISPSSGGANLSKAIDELSSLAQEAVKVKVLCESPSSDIVRMLKEKSNAMMQERDEAVATKNILEVNLARAKVDLMSVNSQLLEAIQQKLQQQKELEAWQDDMEHMIQKALVERNSVNKMKRTQQQSSEPPQPARSSWFSFRRARNPSGESAKSATSSGSDVTLSNSGAASPASDRKSTNGCDPASSPAPNRFTQWLRRKQPEEPPVPNDAMLDDVTPI